MNAEGFQRADGNSSGSNNFHSIGKAILQKFPECLGLFLYSKTTSIGVSLLIDEREKCGHLEFMENPYVAF